MKVITVTRGIERMDALFPAEDEEGHNVSATSAAHKLAQTAAACQDTPTWHLPDVFSVRYGSSYVGTAKFAHAHVRFLSAEGDFLEGDDLGVERA